MRPREILFEQKTSTRHCEHPSCARSTRESKAFCSEHVERHGYVQALLAQLGERERQDEEVLRRGSKAVKLKSVTAQEILQHLAFHGPRTKERLCRELNLEARVLEGYIGAFRRARLVSLGRTKRGSTTVKLRRSAVDRLA